jgi:hypothetical protein
MGKKKRFQNRKKSDYKRKIGNRQELPPFRDREIVLSFRKFDRNQGQSFEEWQKSGLLALAIERLSSLCQHTLPQARAQNIITVYDQVDFPPKTNFEHPRHVPNGVDWASYHIQGKECVIGYFERNIFHIVFLDMNHEFWITEKG